MKFRRPVAMATNDESYMNGFSSWAEKLLMAGYEVDLRRLFRPPLDHLPLSEQLQYYRQRDLRPSHIYRLGTGIFGSEPPRKRIINAALYSPPSRTPHSSLLTRSLDGRPPNEKKKVRFSDATIAAEEPPTTVPPPPPRGAAVSAREFSDQEYKSWLAARQHMRSDLEALGANERWLCSKEQTPLESSLLAQLRQRRREKVAAARVTSSSQAKESTNSSTPDAPSPSETRGNQQRRRKQMLKELSILEEFFTCHRQRLVTLLMTVDRSRDRHVTVGDLVTILTKLKAPVRQDTFELLLQAMGVPLTRNGRVDYRVILKGGLVNLAEEYLRKEGVKVTATGASVGGGDSSPLVSGSKTQGEEDPLHDVATLSQRYSAVSTMSGANGRLVDGYKQEGLRQFNRLVEYCKVNGIVLDWQLAERALLLPPDRPKAECEAHLRQAGLALLSVHFADPPEEEEEGTEQRDPREEFGGAYMELRGKRKARFTRLSTGPAHVEARTDCWMTYNDFKKLTVKIQSRPGFKYKYHGLPDNNAFWPGALLDKLRLWQPSETLLDKPYSLYNIFQPVEHPRIYNPYSPIVVQRKSWPENSRGYVQFGSQTRKSYAL